MKKIPSILSLLLLVLCFNVSRGQQRFNVELIIPSQINTDLLGVEYDNGKKTIKLSPHFIGNKMVVSDSFFSKYATLTLTYPDTLNILFNNRFFISAKPASIEFLNSLSKKQIGNPLLSYKSINAEEILKTKEAKKMALFAASEIEELENLNLLYRNKLRTNDSLELQLNIKFKNLSDKKVAFIKKNGSIYYSLWVFNTEIIQSLSYLSADSLLTIYDNSFSPGLRNSFEGKEIKKLLHGRAFAKNGYQAPDFQFRDDTGRDIMLSDIKDKYVLLNFWASWCIPCIMEIVKLQEFEKTYQLADLKIVSVSYDSDFSKFKEAVEKFNIKWINVFGNVDIINKYGNKVIPGLYLIDKNGKIISNNFEDSEEGIFSALKRLIE